MTYASSLTVYFELFGPAGLTAVGILTFLILLLSLQLVRWLSLVNSAKRIELLFAELSAAQGGPNPARKLFQNERIDLNQIANPLTGQIVGKRFDDCEVYGPATVFLSRGSMYGMTLENINLFPIRPDRPVWKRNIIELVDCEFRGGSMSHLNIVGFPDTLSPFVLEMGAHLLSFSGDDEMDAVDPEPQNFSRSQPTAPARERKR